MLRILILIAMVVLTFAGQLSAMTRHATCYECVQDAATIVCNGQLCGNNADMPLGWDDQGSFANGLYQDTGYRYNGTAWTPLTKKRYESGAWHTTDVIPGSRSYLEPAYMLLLDVMPHRPAFKTLPLIPEAPPIDSNITPVACQNATVTRLFTQPAVGAGVTSYLVGLQCADADTWTGERLFNLAATGKGGLATAMQADISGGVLSVEFTDYTAFAMIVSIVLSL